MRFIRVIVLLLLLSLSVCVWCHCHEYHPQRGLKLNKNRKTESVRNLKLVKINRNPNVESADNRRLEKMLEKAILKIITGDLSKADMQLLKSLNYSLEEILEIREREMGWRNEEMQNQIFFFHDLPRRKNLLNDTFPVFSREREFEEFNRQAFYDYENMGEKQQSEFYESFEGKSSQNDFMEHVIFKIRYDDPDLNSMSEENQKSLFIENLSGGFENKDHSKLQIQINENVSKNSCKSFPGLNFSMHDLCSLAHCVNVPNFDENLVMNTSVEINSILGNGNHSAKVEHNNSSNCHREKKKGHEIRRNDLFNDFIYRGK